MPVPSIWREFEYKLAVESALERGDISPDFVRNAERECAERAESALHERFGGDERITWLAARLARHGPRACMDRIRCFGSIDEILRNLEERAENLEELLWREDCYRWRDRA